MIFLYTLASMSWFYYELLFISLGVSIGLFLAYQGYKYFLSKRKSSPLAMHKIILHNLESRHNSGEILFHFEIEKAQKIILDVCDENFDSKVVLIDKELTEGAHTQIFDTARLPHGIYFYRLKGEQQQVMKKMAIHTED